MTINVVVASEQATRSRGRPLSFAARFVGGATPDAARVVRLVAPGLIALAGAILVWSRFSMLSQGLWGDEAFSIFVYVHGGPGVIWDSSRWLPNNHLLFEFLTWATTGILGSHTEPVDRLWAVFPALGAVALVVWWLWQRVDRWAAAIFAVMITVAPLFFSLGVQARGYGLGFLAAAVILVAADRYTRTKSPLSLVMLGVGGFVGIATLENFVAAFVGTAAVLMLSRSLRKGTLITVACVGVAAVTWYGPLLSKFIGYHNPYGSQLPWYGFVTAPFRDLFGASVHGLAPSTSVTVSAIAFVCVAIAGIVGLWLRRDKGLALLLIVPPLATYLLIEIATGYLPRFASFAMIPLFALAAIGLALAGRKASRSRAGAAVVLVLLLGVSLLALHRFVNSAARQAQVPYEAAKEAGQLVHQAAGFRAAPIVTNDGLVAFKYYSQPMQVTAGPAAALTHTFCSYPGRFIYYEQQLFPPHPPTTCLAKRGGLRIALPERRSKVWVWLVPALTMHATIPRQGHG